MSSHPNELKPFLKLYEKAVVELYAMGATLDQIDGWDASLLEVNREKKYRAIVSQQFSVLYSLLNDPVKLNQALEAMLESNKRN